MGKANEYHDEKGGSKEVGIEDQGIDKQGGHKDGLAAEFIEAEAAEGADEDGGDDIGGQHHSHHTRGGVKLFGDIDGDGRDQRVIGAAHQEIGDSQQGKVPVPEFFVHSGVAVAG